MSLFQAVILAALLLGFGLEVVATLLNLSTLKPYPPAPFSEVVSRAAYQESGIIPGYAGGWRSFLGPGH